MNVSELLNIVNALVPIEYAFEDDYVGITIGSEQSEVNGIVVGHELENPNKVHIVMETPAADTMQKFMQNEENAKVIEKSGHKQETTVMSICSD